MRRRRSAVLAILLTAGCAADRTEPPGGQPSVPVTSPAVASSPAPPPFPVADPGKEACRQLNRIAEDGERVAINRLADVGDLGAQSADPEVRREARLLSDFAAVAATRIGGGADPAQEAGALRGAIRDVLKACAAASFL